MVVVVKKSKIRTTQPHMSRAAAYLALAATARKYKSTKGDKQASLRKGLSMIVQFLVKNWPDSPQAKQAKRIESKLKRLKR